MPPLLAHEWLPPPPPAGFGSATGPSGHRGIVLLLLLLGRPQLTHVQSLSVLRGSVLLLARQANCRKIDAIFSSPSLLNGITGRKSNQGIDPVAAVARGSAFVMRWSCLPRCRQANRHAGQASRQSLPPSPAEPHVTTAGRRLSLIGERASAPAWMGRTTDGGHLFAKKPPDRERGRREKKGEKTLVQWHEFRYDYRCKAGCCMQWYVLLRRVRQ